MKKDLIGIEVIKILDVKKVAGSFAGVVEGLETEGEETYNVNFVYEPFKGANPAKGLELQLEGKFSREYDYEKQTYDLPASSKQTSQSLWDCDLTGFIEGGEIEISNADEVLTEIIKLVNK